MVARPEEPNRRVRGRGKAAERCKSLLGSLIARDVRSLTASLAVTKTLGAVAYARECI